MVSALESLGTPTWCGVQTWLPSRERRFKRQTHAEGASNRAFRFSSRRFRFLERSSMRLDKGGVHTTWVRPQIRTQARHLRSSQAYAMQSIVLFGSQRIVPGEMRPAQRNRQTDTRSSRSVLAS